MIELYLSKVTEGSETEQAGKLYARVSYKQTMYDAETDKVATATLLLLT
jgi:hypothetical protein